MTQSAEQPVSMPSFWQVARQPKWIAAFFGVLAVAAVFAGLAQWQLERTFVTIGTLDPDQPAVPVDQLMTPGQAIASANLDREVSVNARVDLSQSWLVANRQQLLSDGELQNGFWLVTLAEVNHPEFGATDLAVAVGFAPDRDAAEATLARLRNTGESTEIDAVIRGYLEPNEAPITTVRQSQLQPDVLDSLSIGQLVNLSEQDPRPVYPGFVIMIDGITLPAYLVPIRIAIQTATVEVNWLTAFYAIEWAIFGAFAFYVWWRLVTDARLRSVTKS